MDKVSIIIPVYNVEKYLDKCLTSVINQTYRNIEIIIVNDGSTDNSLSICEKYSNIDSRILLFNKSNGGLSDARNFGINLSTGKYITFIDSDDYIDLDYIEYLYYLIKKENNLKMSICSLYNVYNGNIRKLGNGEEILLSSEKCIEKMCYHDQVDTCAYAKLYEISLFKNIKYPKGKLFEDIGTTYKLFNLSKKISCGFKPKYYYNIRENSIVTSKFNNRKLDLIEMTDQMAYFVNSAYPDLKKATLRRQVYSRFSVINDIINTDKNKYMFEFFKFKKFIFNNKRILLDHKVPLRDKIAILLIIINDYLYSCMWKFYIKFIK